MKALGYHASHEQFRPSTLLSPVQAAERAGFRAAMCSDHFHPWSEQQGQSGFAWSWLGAALQATALPLGVVNAPGQRYSTGSRPSSSRSTHRPCACGPTPA
jgi:coenzyme F420-dependent glucose-6-phosphate dehydrogenase